MDTDHPAVLIERRLSILEERTANLVGLHETVVSGQREVMGALGEIKHEQVGTTIAISQLQQEQARTNGRISKLEAWRTELRLSMAELRAYGLGQKKVIIAAIGVISAISGVATVIGSTLVELLRG